MPSPITGLDLRLNGNEFSRFEEDMKVIKARVLPAAIDLADLAETVTVQLFNKHGIEIATKDIDFTGDFSNGKGKIAEFNISTEIHSDGFTAFIHSNGYYAYAHNDGDTLNSTVPFRVALVTVKAMKRTYCNGAPLYSSEIVTAIKQPSLITGLTIIRASATVKKGTHTITYVAATTGPDAPATLKLDGGAEVTLDDTITTELLPDEFGGYIEVEIDHFELPDNDAVEGIVFDLERMPDSTLRDEIDKAVSELENVTLKVDVEPRRFASVPYFSAPEEGTWYDKELDPLPYYKKDFNVRGRGWHLSLPVEQLQVVDEIVGQVGNVAHLSISKGAYVVNRMQGTVDVLPFDSQYAHLYQFFVQINFWGIREFIEGFWRYHGVSGIKETPLDIIKAVGYVAAIPLLTVAGQAYRAGFSSESNSKDGVSRSVSYTASAIYGIYSASISEYQKWLKANIKRLRGTYKGMSMVTV